MVPSFVPVLASLAALAGTALTQAAAAGANTTTTLTPVVTNVTDTVTPSTNVSLSYGIADTALLNVSLSTVHPTVVLEKLAAISAVDCTASSVAVTFNSSAALEDAAAEWNGTLVLITNHLGDCDTELQRGFFLASSFSSDNSTLTITAAGEPVDVATTSNATEIVFSAIPAASLKRAIVINSSGFEISNDLSLDETTLYEYDPYVTVKADSAEIVYDITISGYLKYTILTATLDAFYVDLNSYLSADLVLEVDVDAAYSTSFTYSPDALTYSLIDVPGIITIGPALSFDIGVDLAADAAVNVTGEVGATISDGVVHLDFVDESNTYASGWTPSYNAGLNISEAAAVSVDPFVDVTVEIEFDLFSGALDLSGGITATPRFNVEFDLTASQDVSADGGVTQDNATACAQGVEIVSDFEFSVVAFVTEFWSTTLYDVTVPILDECYSWL